MPVLGDAGCGNEGVRASSISGVDAPPVFQAFKTDLDFMVLSVEQGAVGDVDFAV